jgi:putative heme-binding domain-containing protein
MQTINLPGTPLKVLKLQRRWLVLLPLLCLNLLNSGLEAQNAIAPFELKDGDRVAFVGDTLIEREGTVGLLEHRLTTAFPNRTILFRNLGWSADLPSGRSRASFDWHRGEEHWFTNLLGQIAAVKPTVVFLGYGMAASFDGPSGVDAFSKNMRRLVQSIQKQAQPMQVRFAIASPIRHEDLGSPLPDPNPHNQSLTLYRDALRSLANELGATFVDWFADTTTTSGPKESPALTDNGIHLNDHGYRRLAESLGRHFPCPPPAWQLSLSRDGKTSADHRGVAISDFQRSRGSLRFQVTPNQVLMPGAAGSDVPAQPSASQALVQVKGLRSGNYVLKIDGREVLAGSHTAWEKGLALDRGPLLEAAHELHQTILKKNELFFHRWRPQNSTYLFLFRKGEQGRNAGEIPQFDPLIAEQEARIAKLRQPGTHLFELVPVAKDHVVSQPAAPAPTKTGHPETFSQPTPTFEVAPGYEVNLYAENPKLFKPIHMNFDSRGRLWVASSSVYPQIKPGQTADDAIIVLEDTNGDGKAETSSVFADGLLIPTGVEPGDGGVYVGQSTELLHFKDTNGDGKADVRRTILSGFGTEDTHHIIHTLHWGMDGQMYMNQSIYIHTHTETPNGVVRLNSGGILNLRPSTLELGIHMKGLVNTWGHQFDMFGQSFATDGAGGEGINYIVPQAMYVTYAGARRILGSVSPGAYPKFCGLEVLYSPLFSEDWQGSMITCDFRAHRVVRFSMREQGSAYVTQEMPEILRSQDAHFRPIDVKMGPDGALYIADWSNPIIQHGEVDFRDPRRDKEHGRIWRVTPKGKTPMPIQDLTRTSTEQLLGNLLSPSGYHREKSRRVLTERGVAVQGPLNAWTSRQTDERALLESLWLHQALDVVNAPLLQRLLSATDGRVRAAAVRVLSFWRHRIKSETLVAENRQQRFATPGELTPAQADPVLKALAARVEDEHPRVRLEALRALAKFPTAQAAELALSVLNKPMDPHLEYTLWLTINDLAEPFLAALKAGQWQVAGREKQLEFALKSIEPALAGAVLSQILEQQPLDREGSGNWIEILGQAARPNELRKLYNQVLSGGFTDAAATRAIASLDQAARLRNTRPSGDLSSLPDLFHHAHEPLQVAAVRLAGAWKSLGQRTRELSKLATAPTSSPALRNAVFETLRNIGGQPAVEALLPLSKPDVALDVRRTAVVALAAVDLKAAADPAVQTALQLTTEPESLAFWRALLNIKGSAPILTRTLPKSGIPAVVAKAGMRAARESGRNEPDLILALTRGADLAEGEIALSESELKAMAAEVLKKGDPRRGEEVYRRPMLGCVSCHAIGGAGGKVGPDMTSIGASAPVDYLIESIWFPNRKVKEGFHSLVIETKDGQELSGILVREDGERLVIRDTTGNEVTVAKNDVEKRTTGGSIMPAGLIDGIQPEERLDLFRFLSELGKPGPYDASKANVARGWKLRPGTHSDEQFGVEKMVSLPLTAGGWTASWSQVDGKLTRSEVQQSTSVQKWVGLIAVYGGTKLQVPKAGPVRLELEGLENANVWVAGKPIPAGKQATVDLPAGTHVVTVRLDPKKLPEYLRIGSPDGTFVNP